MRCAGFSARRERPLMPNPDACQHQHGEYSDTYRHCLDCGLELVLIGNAWFEIEGWVRISTALLDQTGLHSSEGVSSIVRREYRRDLP